MERLAIRFHRILSLLLALIWLTSSLVVSAQPAAAAGISEPSPAEGPEFPDCNVSPPDLPCSLQVFLLIDDSSSMLSTDPNRQRLAGVRNALDILAKEYYLPAVDANAKDPDIKLPDIQVSLIRFSSGVHHNSGWKRVDPQDIAAWPTQLQIFDDDLTAEIDYTRPQFTEFHSAFLAAAELAAGNPQISDCPRLVMLFTDGMPNLEDGPMEGEALTKYMRVLQDIIQQTFNRGNDFLYVTVFGSDKTFRRFWDREYLGEWEQIAGNSQELDLRRVSYVPVQELAARMERIIGSTIASQVYTLTPTSGDPQQYITEIPITVESLRLTYYTIDTTTRFTVTEPNGKVIQPDGKNVILSGANTSIQVLEIRNPAPGTYQINTSAAGGLVTQLLRFEKITAELSSPTDPWLQFTNGQIDIQLSGADGNPLAISSQMYIQAALTQAGQTNDLDLTPGSDTFTTNWMPLATDLATVYACVTLKDDQDKKIVLHNGPVGEIQIDPLTVRARQAEKACVPSENVVSVPLQLTNGRSWEPATIDASVRWISRLSSATDEIQPGSTIDEIDAKTGEYVLHFKPASPGDVTFAVWADAIVDGAHNIFYGGEIPTIRIDPPRPMALTLGEPETLGDQLSVMLFKWFDPSCIDDDTQIVIGRRFFGLLPTSVQINGRFIDLGSNLSEPGIKDFTVQLLSLDGGSSSETLSSWTAPANSEDFSTLEIPSPGLGLYKVGLTDKGKNPECTVRESLPTQTILLINHFWEYLILLILILFVALLVIYLLRRYRDRRYSHEIPLILASVVLIALNLILVNLLLKHTFECKFNCDFLIDHSLGTNTLCSEGLGIPIEPFDLIPSFTIGPIVLPKLWPPWPPWTFTLGPFRIGLTIPANLIPFLPPFNALDPSLEVLRQHITRIIIVFIALASLVTALILKRLLTPEGRKTVLTYLGLWLLFFVILSSLFYFGVVY